MRHDVYKEEGIFGDGEVWTYTPGNGTLYKFIVTRYPMGASIGGLIGEVEGPCAFVYCHNGDGHGHLLMQDSGYLAPSYVAEKFGVKGEDLAAVMVALGVILGREGKSYDELVSEITGAAFAKCERCGRPAQAPHSCPFKVEIHDDGETLCACCEECSHECAMDV